MELVRELASPPEDPVMDAPPTPPALDGADSEPLTPFPPASRGMEPLEVPPVPIVLDQATVRLPCYATALNTFAAFAPIRARQNMLLHTLDELLAILKARYQAEDAYARALQRVSSQPLSCVPSTLGDALEGLRSDVVNRAVQHSGFGQNLARDVHGPLTELRGAMARKIKSIGNAAMALQKDVRAQEDRYRKTIRAYEKAEKDAEDEIRTVTQHGLGLVPESAAKEVSDILDGRSKLPQASTAVTAPANPKAKSITQSFKSGLGLLSGSRSSQSPGDVVNWLLPSEDLKKEFALSSAHQKIAEAEALRRSCVSDWTRFVGMRRSASVRLQILLTEAQLLEEELLTAVQDALRKHAVFESSALANQQYDVQMIFQVMESVDWQLDLMKGMNDINASLHGDPLHDAETDLGAVEMSPSVQGGARGHFSDPSSMPSREPSLEPQTIDEILAQKGLPPNRSSPQAGDANTTLYSSMTAALAPSPSSGQPGAKPRRSWFIPEPPTKPVLGLTLTDRNAQTVVPDLNLDAGLARASLPQVTCGSEDPNLSDAAVEAVVTSGPNAGTEPAPKITSAADVMAMLESMLAAQTAPAVQPPPPPSPAFDEASSATSPPVGPITPELVSAARRLSIDDDDNDNEMDDDDESSASDRQSPAPTDSAGSSPSEKGGRLRFRSPFSQRPRMGWGKKREANAAMEEEGKTSMRASMEEEEAGEASPPLESADVNGTSTKVANRPLGGLEVDTLGVEAGRTSDEAEEKGVGSVDTAGDRGETKPENDGESASSDPEAAASGGATEGAPVKEVETAEDRILSSEPSGESAAGKDGMNGDHEDGVAEGGLDGEAQDGANAAAKAAEAPPPLAPAVGIVAEVEAAELVEDGQELADATA